MTRFAIITLFAFALSACGRGTPVVFDNQSKHQLEAVEISGSGFKASLGAVAPEKSLSAQVYPSGESGLAVSFTANGQDFSFKPQDYFEGGGSYKVSVTVREDLSVIEIGRASCRERVCQYV